MTDHAFDRLARLLSGAGSRRQALAALAAVPLARAHRASAASQIETAACGEAGAVCTQLIGCCAGMVCATSYTNPAYGVCVAGEGEMLPVSDDIVVPGAEGIEDELAAEVTDAGATDAASALAAQDAEIQSRHDARRSRNSTQQSRRRTNQSTQQSRRRANHGDTHEKKLANQNEKEFARDLKKKPKLQLRLFKVGAKPETLYIENRDHDYVAISRVQSINDTLLFDEPGVSIAPDGIYTLKTADWTDPDEQICSGPLEEEGVYVWVTKSGATKRHRFKVLCE